jgi:hypothetical protein
MLSVDYEFGHAIRANSKGDAIPDTKKSNRN